MIATITTPAPKQFEFQALLSGVLVDEVAEGVYDVTYRDAYKVLGLIQRAGGRVVATTSRQPLTKSERFVK